MLAHDRLAAGLAHEQLTSLNERVHTLRRALRR